MSSFVNLEGACLVPISQSLLLDNFPLDKQAKAMGIWGLGMMLFMLVFWALVIVGLVLGLRWLATQGRESRSDAALDILRQRYARGEINQDEFDAPFTP